MKKTAILLLIVILALSTILVIPVKATEQTTIEANTSTNLVFTPVTTEEGLTITISTGTFEGLEENIPMSASMTLVYDENNIIRVEGTTNSDWKINVTEETKRVLIESDKAKSNTEIAKITFYFNQEVTQEATGNISIQEINVSDGNLYEETYPEFTQTYTINPSLGNYEENNQPNTNELNELPEINTNTEINQEQYKSSNKNDNSKNSNEDNTVAPNSIPQTGISMGVVLVIVAIVAIAIVCFIKYKSIEIK